MTKHRIHYAQCWEDPATVQAALRITPQDNLLSIASAGDNTFALLLDNPASVTAIDCNPAQIYLTELKMCAIQVLTYEDCLYFLGVTSCTDRQRIYNMLKNSLSEDARHFWDNQPSAIDKGVIHWGKFEAYFALFRRWILPLIHSRKTCRDLLQSRSRDEREKFYVEKWDCRRWRWLFRAFFNETLLGKLGRYPDAFKFVSRKNIAEVLLERSRRGLTTIDNANNYFLDYILNGKFTNQDLLPSYLLAKNFAYLKNNLERIRLVCTDINTYLQQQPAATFSAFNLSDVFEYMSPSLFKKTMANILRVSGAGARIAFWHLFIPRPLIPAWQDFLKPRSQRSEKLYQQSRTFFYGGFQLWELLTNSYNPEGVQSCSSMHFTH